VSRRGRPELGSGSPEYAGEPGDIAPATCGPKNTPSVSRAARRVAPSLWAPISSGGCGIWWGVKPMRAALTRV
jgi:hypothetical protein